ncbi:hypothetical protein HY031_02355 [Candidatus Gottesmanbacteria bacterium]|nr:hypothetical protein [Candidatus Gottesmanbacteria bacterium]
MKRLLIFFVIILLSSSFLVPLGQSVYAQTPTPPLGNVVGTAGAGSWVTGSGYDAALQEGVNGGSNAEAFATLLVYGAIPCALVLSIAGIPCNNPSGTAQNPSFYADMQQRSLLGGVSKGIAMIYANPPADFGYWLADVGQSIGLPKPAYAQGIGFSGLTPILPVWKAFRNIAYLILAVVMIVIGFMVMLRKKIDPKTVVTVQNALPRIIITLILITFSYAIVGFLIDLMYLVILLVVSVLASSLKGSNLPELQAAFTAGGFSQVWRIYSAIVPLTHEGAASGIVGLLFTLGGGPLAGIISTLITGLLTGLVTGNGITFGLFSPILLVLLALSLLVTIVRILFILINAYIQVLIALIFGPLQIMLGAVPGINSFGSWLTGLVVNLLTFPIVAALIILGASIGSNITNNSFWIAPLVPRTGTQSFIQALIGLGIVMSIPSVVNAVKEALKVKPAIPTGAGVLTQPILGAGGTALQLGSQFFYIASLGQIIRNWRKPPEEPGGPSAIHSR